jgi:dTDP-4-dehydrorhamnose 3,5-epimerase
MGMRFTATELAIPGLLAISPRRFDDARGYFMETYRASDFAEIGVRARFVQDNQALSKARGTIRGLHFQRPPHAQAKLVRAIRGVAFDVIVDLRAGSPAYGKWVSVTLEPDGQQVFIPQGCAHGYATLEPDTEIAYKCDAYYAAEADSGINFADPAIAIAWPVALPDAVVSDKDRALPLLRDFASPFVLEMT